MKDSSRAIIESVFKTDETIDEATARAALAVLSGAAPDAVEKDFVMSRADAAKMIRCTTRTIDTLAKQGVIRRVVMPTRKRGVGILASSLVAAMKGKGLKGKAVAV